MGALGDNYGTPPSNDTPGGSGSAYGPDGTMATRFAVKRLQRMQRGSLPTQRPGHVQPPPRPVKLKGSY